MNDTNIKRKIVTGFACAMMGVSFLVPSGAYAVDSSEVDAARERLTSLGNQMNSLQSSIDEQEAALQETESQLNELERDLVQSEAQLGRVKDKLSKRMRSIYKAGASNLITLALNSSTFDELVSNVYYADKVAARDSQLIATVKGMRQEIETERMQMESLKSDQEASINAMREQANAFDSVVEDAQRYFESLNGELQAQLAAEAEVEAQKAAEDTSVRVSAVAAAVTNVQNKKAAAEQAEQKQQPQSNQEQPSEPADTSGNASNETLPFSGSEVADAWGDPGYVDQMRAKAARYGSSTGWICFVDNETCRVTVFVESEGSWALAFSSTAGLGRLQSDGTYRTFTGHYRVDHKAPSYTEPALDNYWWTCFLPCWSSSNYDINGCSLRYYPGQGYDDGQGFHSSSAFLSGHRGNAGCTCLPIDNAKWIYDHVPIGSDVVVFANYDPNP